MNRSAVVIAITTIASGCALTQSPYPYPTAGNFAPTISKDGTHGFTYTVNGDGSIDQPGLQQDHELLISQELGRRQFCGNGYDIIETKKLTAPDKPYYMITYVGRCK